ncbi:MAG: ABC transporter permease, partial [Bacteroidetes bacterium]|nr:ABC transporter permease [Bacteroidota bacterium]
MLTNYLKIAIRTLIRNRGTSLINIIGLAIGLASCILIFLYVRFELSFDKFHADSERIFRVLTIDEALGVSSNLVGITMPSLGETMKNELPQVENSIRMNGGGRTLLRYEDQTFYTEHIKYAEPSFLEMFDYPWKEGDKTQALTRPSTGVLTNEMATKIFGKENAIGKVLRLENGSDIEVTGVLDDPPANSHLSLDLIVSRVPAEGDSSIAQYLQSWGSISMITYVKLADKNDETLVEEKMEEIIRQHDVGDNFSVTLQPLEDVHLKSSGILFDGYNQHKTDRGYVITLMVVAFFIILIASFNFMNLSTARSSNRAREVGMRKVLGAFRQQLILQFLGESVLLCVISLILALGLVALVDDLVPLGLDEHLLVYLFRDKGLLFSMLGGTILLGLLSGSYPALLLSSFKPVKVLKGKFLSSSSGIWLRRSLVVVQFTASIGMIIGTIIVSKQLDLIKSQDKGFDPEQIVTITLGNPQVRNSYENLKNEWSQIPAIKKIASSTSMPGGGFGRNGIQPEGA